MEKIIIRNTQPVHDVPGTSPEGPLKFLTSRTYKGPSEDSQGTNTKIDDLMKKLFSRSNSHCITYLFLFFYRKNKYSKLLDGDVQGTSTRSRFGTSMRPKYGTSVKHVSKIKLANTLNVLWQVTQDFLMNGSSEKFSEQFSGQNSYLNRKQTWWVQQDIMKVWLESL